MSDSLLDEFAGSLIAPECSPEGSLDVGFVVLTHDFANSDRGFAGVVEGNGGDEVVADVGADNVVEEMGVDKSEITIDCGRCTTSESPGLVVVVRHRSVGVLKESDGN